jgi:hypothetical protein
MANTGSKTTSPSTPPKGKPPAKAVSPPRKSAIDRSPLKTVKSSKDQIVRYKEVGIEGVCLAFCYKPDGINPSYIAPIIRYLDDSEGDKAAGHIMFLAQLRDSTGANVPLQTPSATGKLYSTDVIVMSIDDPRYTYFSAIGDLVNVLNDAAHNSVVRPQWQFQVPNFVNRGRATPPTVVPLSTYLLNDDCISFIKRFWENCESKDALNNNEHRDVILKEVFGSADEGWQALENISEEAYELL